MYSHTSLQYYQSLSTILQHLAVQPTRLGILAEYFWWGQHITLQTRLNEDFQTPCNLQRRRAGDKADCWMRGERHLRKGNFACARVKGSRIAYPGSVAGTPFGPLGRTTVYCFSVAGIVRHAVTLHCLSQFCSNNTLLSRPTIEKARVAFAV